ncbi:MAG: DNA internalization-related competence protein ComEC/Rec2 [Desulfuromonadales bacterium]|nr:DNA internalization-related competence protein ComEC/Rec2 [Desulfuromonadales bacterium]
MRPFVLLAAYATGVAMVRFVAPWDMTGYGMSIGFLLLLWAGLYRLPAYGPRLPDCGPPRVRLCHPWARFCHPRAGRHSPWAWVPLLGLLLVAGFLNASLQLKPPAVANHISRFADISPLIFEGTVITTEKRATGGYRLLVEMRQAMQKQAAATVSGEILLYIKQGELTVRPGQIVRWRSRLRRPFRFGNPGEFDYPLYLAARGVYATAFIAHAEDLAVLVNHPEQQSKSLDNLRHTLAAHIEKTVPEDAAGLVQSLLLGIRGGVSKEQRQLLSASGVAHLFAISGLHFGLLALLLYQMGKWLYTRSQRLMLWCPPQRILPVLLIVPLAAYLFLTGNAWATRRAFLMVSLFALLFASGRRTPAFALLATVALCLLLFNPLALFQPGFQLSFAGVAGILAWLPCWQRPLATLSKPIRWSLTLILTTTAATLATAPATLWHFHQLAPAGLLTNLVAIPLIAWGAVPVGLVSMASLPFSTLLADWGLLLSAKLVTIAINLVSIICQWPGLAAIPLYLTASTLILLIGTLFILLPFGKEKRHWLCRLAILLTSLGGAWLAQPQVADFQVTALSVGQGDATLVSLADDIHYLVDGGGLPGSSIDPGEQLIAPALGRMGVDHLQGVVLTHNHPDHSSGLTYILRHFPVENFYFAGELAKLAPELLEVLQQRNVTMQRLDEGWTHLHEGWPHRHDTKQTLSLFAPLQSSRDINERSIAVFAGNQQDGVLLTADLGKRGLQQLIAVGLPGRASLLKLPHHGSRHAQPKLYLDWVKPSAAFVSAGRGNSYGFPHQQTIEACTTQQVPLFRTDLEGMLTFHMVNGQWQRQRPSVMADRAL